MNTTFGAAPYRPSYPLTGDGQYLYRAANMLLSGLPSSGMFYRAYGGNTNLSEPLPTSPLTGTLAFSPASLTITGSSTLFLDELNPFGNSMFTAGTDFFVVNTIESQTSLTVYKLPTTTETSVTGHRTRILLPLNNHRASLLSGDASFTDRGNIIAAGSGALYFDGAVLPGTSLVATRRAKIAIYDSTTNTYAVVPLGFDEIPIITNADITVVASGGTKNTSLGYYSFRVAYYSDTTDGYGNPTATMLQAGLDGYHVTAANSTFNFDFSSDVANRPDKATGYIIYASAFGGSSDISKVSAIQGAWFELRRIPFADLTAEAIAFDYVDSDLSSTLASFDNDTPPDASFISLFAGYVNLISTGGQGVNTARREAATSPGPFIAPMKADNIDAYPADQRVPTEKGETIIGYINAAGRMFPMTPNTLQASTPTGLPTSPFTLRPFWQRGFATPWNLTCIDDTLYGFTTKGPYRYIATGDSAEASNDFAASVDAQMAEWNPGYVFVAYDPKNSAICYFHSACSQNDAGYWETEIYPFSLKINDWMPRVLLTNDVRDMIVTGAAQVHNDLCFIAGGRRAATTARFDTWIFDGFGTDIPWFLTYNFTDSNVEMIGKIIHKLRVKAKLTGAKIQIYAVFPDTAINVDDLTTGDNPVFEAQLDDVPTVEQYAVIKCRVKNALMWTVRISGMSVNAGTFDSLDSLHEISVDYSVAGQQR